MSNTNAPETGTRGNDSPAIEALREQNMRLKQMLQEARDRTEHLVLENAGLQSLLGDAKGDIVELLAAIEIHFQGTFGHSACFERDERLWEQLTRRDGLPRKWVRDSLPPEQEHEAACAKYRCSLFTKPGR